MEGYGFVADRVARVREGIAEAARRSGRDPAGVALMAVTKFHPLAAVEAAYAAGVRLFGENRVQEAEGKYAEASRLFPGARVELIGSLQSNKAKKACALFDAVQSVDSLDLVRELDKRARSLGRRLDILLELHTGEESKAGFPDLDGLLEACDLVAGLQSGVDATGAPRDPAAGLALRGLMTMAPYTTDEAPIRASFRKLRSAFDELARRHSFPGFSVLSMGMTNDYLLAVEEGSTLVRIGTAIFGARDGA
jgi:pyridoxal phosphate enzyme (YggS family)